VTDVSPQLRRATAADVRDVVALVESAYRGEASRAGWTTEADLIDGQRVDAAMVAPALADPSVVLLVLVDDGGIVACCELRSVGGAVATFGMFAVSPTRQGEGLGHRLLSAAEQVAADDRSATHLRLSVIHLRVELIDWYRRRGYEPTGEVLPFPHGDERYGRPRRDDLHFLVLEKELRP
jgi:GNAT superfamily N-acetyltransferase